MGKKRGKPGKRPGIKTDPPPRSVRADHEPDEINGLHPVWSIQGLDRDGPWGWEKISKTELLEVVDRLRHLETMTWSEISKVRSCGYIPISKLCSRAQEHLIEAKKDDADFLYKIRVNTRARIWGVRQGQKFLILWWDPEHTVYPIDVTDNQN